MIADELCHIQDQTQAIELIGQAISPTEPSPDPDPIYTIFILVFKYTVILALEI